MILKSTKQTPADIIAIFLPKWLAHMLNFRLLYWLNEAIPMIFLLLRDKFKNRFSVWIVSVFLLFFSGNQAMGFVTNTYGKDLVEQDSVHTELKWKKKDEKKMNENENENHSGFLRSGAVLWSKTMISLAILPQLKHDSVSIGNHFFFLFRETSETVQSTATNLWTKFKCEVNIGRISLKLSKEYMYFKSNFSQQDG